MGGIAPASQEIETVLAAGSSLCGERSEVVRTVFSVRASQKSARVGKRHEIVLEVGHPVRLVPAPPGTPGTLKLTAFQISPGWERRQANHRSLCRVY